MADWRARRRTVRPRAAPGARASRSGVAADARAERLEPWLLPALRIVAGARRSRRIAPRAPLFVLLARVGAQYLRVRLLRRSRRAVRHRGAGHRAEGSSSRAVRQLRRVPENR